VFAELIFLMSVVKNNQIDRIDEIDHTDEIE